tara:strand:- start:109 stop:369 length:261 start_codon:yes stop_codon:yes gene_type:complete
LKVIPTKLYATNKAVFDTNVLQLNKLPTALCVLYAMDVDPVPAHNVDSRDFQMVLKGNISLRTALLLALHFSDKGAPSIAILMFFI